MGLREMFGEPDAWRYFVRDFGEDRNGCYVRVASKKGVGDEVATTRYYEDDLHSLLTEDRFADMTTDSRRRLTLAFYELRKKAIAHGYTPKVRGDDIKL